MKLIKKIKAPSFKLKSTNDEEIDLKSIKSSYIVLYFYPKDDTPGCTIETNDFNKFLRDFKKLDCEIYGISKDDIKSHKKFKTKYDEKYSKFLKVAFSQPRKTLFKNLSQHFDKLDIEQIFNRLNIEKNIRPHQISEELFYEVFSELKGETKNGKSKNELGAA